MYYAQRLKRITLRLVLALTATLHEAGSAEPVKEGQAATHSTGGLILNSNTYTNIAHSYCNAFFLTIMMITIQAQIILNKFIAEVQPVLSHEGPLGQILDIDLTIITALAAD